MHNSLGDTAKLFKHADFFLFVSMVDRFEAARVVTDQAKAEKRIVKDMARRERLGRLGRHRSLNDPDIRLALSRLGSVVEVRTFNDSDIPCLPVSACHLMPKGASFGHWSHMWPMFWAERLAFEMVRAHEARAFPPALYDVIFRVRPDTAVMPLPSVKVSAWQPFALYDIVYHLDIFAMMMRSVAGAYFSAAEYLVEDNCHRLPSEPAREQYCRGVPAWSSQCFLRTLLRMHLVREIGWSLPTGFPLRTEMVRPTDLSGHGRVPSEELWPARCTGTVYSTRHR